MEEICLFLFNFLVILLIAFRILRTGAHTWSQTKVRLASDWSTFVRKVTGYGPCPIRT
jgi:hypothetical protein